VIANVNTTAPTASRSPGRPSVASSPAEMRKPSSATPTRSRCRPANETPGNVELALRTSGATITPTAIDQISGLTVGTGIASANETATTRATTASPRPVRHRRRTSGSRRGGRRAKRLRVPTSCMASWSVGEPRSASRLTLVTFQPGMGTSEPLAGRDLAAFVAAVETGSVQGAADALQLTQSAATKRLQALERRVGRRLLHRGPRGAHPTAAGKLLYPEAKQALDALGA